MARKSRKKSQIGFEDKSKNERYEAGIYARLSVADGDLDKTSIETQILIAKKYLEEQKDIFLREVYIDRGQTGTNFERPAFFRLLEDIQEGKINCIIVKDFSRFGRNYLEVGEYLENYFPKENIRFISVNDHFDSMNKEKQDDFVLSLNSIINDSYAKDISKKVSTAIAAKKSAGKFMGSKPPYGYRRSKKNKYQLEIVEVQAEIVRRIYEWRLEGLGSAVIAKRLNNMGIPSWQKLRFQEGFADGREDALWRGASVTGILKNPCYLGSLVERKSEKTLYKGGVRKVMPRESWSIIENTHQPIISREIFDKVQASFETSANPKGKLRKKNKMQEKTKNYFRGRIQCGVCGGILQRSAGYSVQNGTLLRHAFYCPKKYLKSGVCTAPSVDEQKLKEILFLICKQQVAMQLHEEEKINWEQMCQAQGDAVLAFLCEKCLHKIIVKQNYICIRLK